jgi:hypothetical protein
MLLNEIFNTQNKVTWSGTDAGLEGYFDIDGDEYIIDAEEYEIDLPSGKKSALDVGFRKGLSSRLTGDQKPARVLGSVLNGLQQKVNELSPNIIMFGALDVNGEVEKRKIIYAKAASLLRKTTKFNHLSQWFKFSGGEYAFLADFIPSDEDIRTIKQIATIEK